MRWLSLSYLILDTSKRNKSISSPCVLQSTSQAKEGGGQHGHLLGNTQKTFSSFLIVKWDKIRLLRIFLLFKQYPFNWIFLKMFSGGEAFNKIVKHQFKSQNGYIILSRQLLY